ncbi:MAG: hypothetical protein H0U20_03225 [Thermoleophilaceae bacterium]|nr:hypothetical protein [Thermoleophilaceae bacterium]
MPARAKKFTGATREAVLGAVRAGVSLEDSCRGLGVSCRTVSNWLSRGRREGSGPFADFARDVERARADHEREVAERGLGSADLLRLLERAARRGSVQAARFLVERLDRERAGGRESNPSHPGGFDELARRRQPGAA